MSSRLDFTGGGPGRGQKLVDVYSLNPVAPAMADGVTWTWKEMVPVGRRSMRSSSVSWTCTARVQSTTRQVAPHSIAHMY